MDKSQVCLISQQLLLLPPTIILSLTVAFTSYLNIHGLFSVKYMLHMFLSSSPSSGQSEGKERKEEEEEEAALET